MPANEWKLWYRKPADDWVCALPIGNGRLGGMAYGGVRRERIQLNEDTLWSGHPRDPNNEEAYAHLAEARALVWVGNYAEAQAVIESHMLGPWNESYQSLGELQLAFDGGESFAGYRRGDEPADYRRELDLATAVARTTFELSGVRYTREAFVSAVDQVMVVRLTADKPGSIHFQASLDSPLEHAVRKAGIDAIALGGQAPSHVEPYYIRDREPVRYEADKGMTFAARLRAVPEGGHLETTGGRLIVQGANAVTLLLAAATSFAGFAADPRPGAGGRDADAACAHALEAAASFPYAALKERHIADHRSLFGRVTLTLGGPDRSDLPTDERIERLKTGGSDNGLAALFFQYGRYLLIASSRPGTQPATLQGIWNDMVRPPWTCNYTTNINTQMNYWLAEPGNLAECHTPLFDMLDELRVAGSRTARVHYGARGWVAHHGIDLWRTTTPSGGPSKGPASWAFWPMAGPWLAQHPWEHYAFGGDKAFLAERTYPIMKEAALFCLDWLVPDGRGRLVTNPSTSPENSFALPDGRKAAVSAGSTMDIALIRELFANCIAAAEIVGGDDAFAAELKRALGKLPPMRIGRHGQLQEWLEDFEEAEPGHRHTAHLYPLHPGVEIDRRRTPELAEAVRVTLCRRHAHEKEDAIGWCFAWMVNQYARLEEAEMAHEYLLKLLRNPYPNLFNAHRHPKITFYPLTIEANFGGAAGIAEMLLQSHAGELHLLPALPAAWADGDVSGLRARGGFELAMSWQDGKLRRATIVSGRGGVCRVRSAAPLVVQDAEGCSCGAVAAPDGVVTFVAAPGAAYQLIGGTASS